MNPATSHQPRETQTLRCCGVVYRRWRFVGKKFPGTQHNSCFMCSRALNWPNNYRSKPRKKQFRDAYRRRAMRFLFQGLTSRGTPRLRPAPGKAMTPRRYDPMYRHKWSSAGYQRRSAKFAQAGLTSRGTRRIYQLDNRSDLDRAYETLRAGINTDGISWDTIEYSLQRQSAMASPNPRQ
jgi:hypothetical protein